jgi:periplasmic protein TonB
MKTISMSIIIWVSFISCATNKKLNQNSQCVKTENFSKENPVFLLVDEMPEFPNGKNEFSKFIFKNLKYPEQDIYQGSITYSFIVDKNGSLSNIKIYNKKEENYTPLHKEAIKVLQSSPKWKAGKCDSQAVSVNVIIPLKFQAN